MQRNQAELRAAIESRLAELLVPGAVVLHRTPDSEFLEAFGTRDLAAGPHDPVQVTDHFRVGSNTKTVTGTVVLQLVADPDVDLGLDDPVSRHFTAPGTSRLDEVTVRHLLEMKSGLSNYSDSLAFNQRLDDPATTYDIDELIVEGVLGESTGTPGGTFHYSNTNTAILGKIIEKLDGRELAESFRERIFDPLGLKHTSLPSADDRTMPLPHAQGYMFGTNVSTKDTMELSPADQERAHSGELAPNDYTELTPSWTWAAGGLISTAGDLATYVRAMVMGDRGLLPADLQRQRLESVVSTDPSDPRAAGYGLGLAQFGPMLGHDGTLPGYQSFMGHDPEKDETLVVLTNLSAAPDGKLTANEIAMLLLT